MSNVRHSTIQVDPANVFYREAGLTETIQGFVNELSLRRFAMYVFDYGAPVGFNLAVANPDSITAIVTQNGNAYEEGLGDAPWVPLREYWKQPSPAIRETIKERMSAPLLAMWGKNDTFFIPPGAEAFRRDVPNADVRFVDAGHFALETNVDDYAEVIINMKFDA